MAIFGFVVVIEMLGVIKIFYRQDHIKQMEEVKSKQDLLIDSMNEDIKRLTDRKAEMI